MEINDKVFFSFDILKEYILFLIYKTNVFIKLLKLKLMINLNILICEFIVLIGFFVFVSRRKHLLSILLILEFIVLCLFILIFFFLNFLNFEMYFLIVFLTFRVCEGSLGLSILVSIIRTHGNDYFQSFNIL